MNEERFSARPLAFAATYGASVMDAAFARNFHLLRTMQRFNELIALDYVTPYRVLGIFEYRVTTTFYPRRGLLCTQVEGEQRQVRKLSTAELRKRRPRIEIKHTQPFKYVQIKNSRQGI